MGFPFWRGALCAWQAVYAISAAVMLSIMAFLCLPRQLAMSNFYMFMASVLYINIGGAQDFWFTADEKCVPGGPVSWPHMCTCVPASSLARRPLSVCSA